MNSNALNYYKQTSVQTSPENLLIMLYDGALKFIARATKEIEAKNTSEAHKYIIKTQDIITELMITLDMKYPISKNLYAMYEYMNRRLIEANTKKAIEPIIEVAGYLSEFREAFAQAAIQAKVQGQGQGQGQGIKTGGVSIDG